MYYPVSASLQPPTTTISPFFVSVKLVLIVFVLIQHVNDTIQYLSFSDWLISLVVMASRFIHVVIRSKISFFFFK